jgi:threonine dehydrogenase-like Zn-dependent dehydrogenase
LGGETPAWCGGAVRFRRPRRGHHRHLRHRPLHYDEITLQGVFHFTPAAVAEARDLLAGGAVQVAPLISARLPMAPLAEAFSLLQRGEGTKYALIPEAADG